MEKVKFLIIRFSSIGDIVLTTPVLRTLKKQIDNVEIHYVIKKQFKSILEANPYIDKLHIFDGNFKQLLASIKKENIHYIIDLHRNIRTQRIKLTLRTLSFSFNKLNKEKWLLVNCKINKLPKIHIVDRYLNTLKSFNIKNDNKGLDYFIPEKDRIEIKALPIHFQKGYVVFVVGAKHFTKQIPVEKAVLICKGIKFPVIILGGKEDYEKAESIVNSSKGEIFNACGLYSINQSASIIKNSELVITSDTGMMHIAAAFKKIIYSVWGNTIPEFGMFPYFPDKRSKIFEVKDLKCRPCSKIGFNKCPKKHFKCMTDVDEQAIIRNINELKT